MVSFTDEQIRVQAVTGRVLRCLQPRDARSAARTISPLCIVAAGVTVLFALVDLIDRQQGVTVTSITVLVAGVIVGVGWATRHLDERHTVAWGSLPFLGVALIAGFDIASGDASVAAQVFFFFPVLYASSCLFRTGAIVVTVTAVVGEALVVFVLSPFREGLTEVGYVTAALVTAATLMIASAERQAVLVARLRRQAAVDPLTGLVTRRVLDRAAQSALSGAASASGTALLLLDVDNFKGVNDEFGHPAGDEVLVQLAGLLIRGCRPTDIVARLGGDEIAVLLSGCSEDAVMSRAGKILVDVRTHPFLISDGRRIRVSVTIGVAHAPTHAADLQSLYVTADAALYRAKRSGGDQIGRPETPGEPLSVPLGRNGFLREEAES